MKLRSLMAALAVACFAMGSAKAENLVIGVGTDAAYTPFYLALERGIFKKHGLDVQFLKFSNGGEAVDAVVAGQAQLSGAAEQTTMIRMARGADLRPTVIYEESGSYIKLVTKPDIADVKQIKTFGVVKGSVSEYSASLAMSKFGVDPSTVKIVPAGPPELPALLARGDIDGYFAWEPWPSIGIRQGGKALLTSGDVGYAYTMWLTASGAWLDKNMGTAKSVVAALTEVNAQITAEPDKAAQEFQAITKLPASDTVGFLKTTKWDVRPFTERDYASFDKIVDFMVSQKISATKVDFRTAMQKGQVK
ncbi:ABC transporter substrate-binding protein [Rhizobium puerariae]|uniref:ABC transporter substrate-binding protein n=1 Tax=Rhizobium puerariae TaxID=1585791 RepID=A0ABV6ABN9_9HYPH